MLTMTRSIKPRRSSKSDRRQLVHKVRQALGSSAAGPPDFDSLVVAAENMNDLLRISTDDAVSLAIIEAPTALGATSIRPLSGDDLSVLAAGWQDDAPRQRVRRVKADEPPEQVKPKRRGRPPKSK